VKERRIQGFGVQVCVAPDLQHATSRGPCAKQRVGGGFQCRDMTWGIIGILDVFIGKMNGAFPADRAHSPAPSSMLGAAARCLFQIP
jgi:hypothetical protein